MLEKDIEVKVCDYFKKLGFSHYKFVSPSNRGVPDRVLFKNGFTFFIEFKSEKGNLMGLQVKKIKKFRDNKISVFVINNVDDGYSLADRLDALITGCFDNTLNKIFDKVSTVTKGIGLI